VHGSGAGFSAWYSQSPRVSELSVALWVVWGDLGRLQPGPPALREPGAGAVGHGRARGRGARRAQTWLLGGGANITGVFQVSLRAMPVAPVQLPGRAFTQDACLEPVPQEDPVGSPQRAPGQLWWHSPARGLAAWSHRLRLERHPRVPRPLSAHKRRHDGVSLYKCLHSYFT